MTGAAIIPQGAGDRGGYRAYGRQAVASAALLTGLQSDRNVLLKTQGNTAKGSAKNDPRTLGRHRGGNRQIQRAGMPKLFRRSRI